MKNQDPSGEILTIREAAKRLGVNPAKVRRLRAEGAFPHARQYGDAENCRWHIPASDVEDYQEARVQACQVAPRPTTPRAQRR